MFVSILIPTYNNEKLFRRLLFSILSQSYNNFEVIVCDDSNNNSVQKEVLLADDARVYYYKNQSQLGSPQNWNRCLDMAKGQLIKFMHHDDFFANQNSLAIFVDYFQKNLNCDFVFCNSVHVDRDEKVVSTYAISQNNLKKLQSTPSYIFPYNIIGAPSVTCFRPTNLRFDSKLKWVVDIDYYFYYMKTNRIGYINEDLIKIQTDLESRVTNQCVDNKDIELFEWGYLYNKINTSHSTTIRQKLYMISFFANYKIFSLKQLFLIFNKDKLGVYSEIDFKLLFIGVWVFRKLKRCKVLLIRMMLLCK